MKTVNPRLYTILLCLILILSPWTGKAEDVYPTDRDTGLKYLVNYDSKDYDFLPQNWCITRDHQGIVFIANQSGVFEYDGVSFRRHPIPNLSVRSLALHHDGSLYAGGKNELGFLAPGPDGNLHYTSLVPHLEPKHRDFANVWQVLTLDDTVFFRTSRFFFRWSNGRVKTWETSMENRFNASFTYGGQLYVQVRHKGLNILRGNSMTPVPGLAGHNLPKLRMMLPFKDGKILMGTIDNRLLLFDGTSIHPFAPQTQAFLEKNRLYHGIRLANGHYALATLRGGVAFMDTSGKMTYVLDQKAGLLDNDVKYLYQDTRGILWAALNQGIAKVEYRSPLSFFDRRTGLEGIVLSVTRHQGVLYAGTTSGLYRLEQPLTFRPVPGVTGMCWALLSLEDTLLIAAGGSGTVALTQGKARIIVKTPSHALCRSGKIPGLVWAGTTSGPAALRRGKQGWAESFRLEGAGSGAGSMAEDGEGHLWLGTFASGVVQISNPMDPIKRAVHVYDTGHGLPAEEIRVCPGPNHLVLATQKGLFRFHRPSNTFQPDHTLGETFADGSHNVFRLAMGPAGDAWFHSYGENFRALPGGKGSYTVVSAPYRRMPRVQVNTLYPEKNRTWFGTNEGLLLYDTTVEGVGEGDFLTLVRRVTVRGKDALYRGYPGPPAEPLAYDDRNLRFQFAAPFFQAEERTVYRCRLEGYDASWSEPTAETHKDYTNLDPGSYRFRVKGENAYGREGKEAVYAFRVKAPWYRTGWAWSVYVLLAGFLALRGVKWRYRALEKEKEELEHLVRQRTAEIAAKNLRLREQADQLGDQAEQLKEMDRVKSRFFANISHEFRTPLTLMIGPIEQMLEAHPDPAELEKKLGLMLRNSRRLLALINQLLDLSRIDGGKMKLQSREVDAPAFLKGVTAAFQWQAEQKGVRLVLETGEEIPPVVFDPEKMEKVVGNLLANGVKFTPAGGCVTVGAAVFRGGHGEEFPGGCLEIWVRDTGTGIPVDRAAYIFERFYQAGGPESRAQGTGIGLALAKELVLLHGGVIDVQSREGRGTDFTIRLPLLEPGDSQPKTRFASPQITDEATDPLQSGVQGEPPPGAPRAGAPGGPPEAAHGGETIILVVEDNADMRGYIREPLLGGYTVVEAADGEEGVAEAVRVVPDLVVSDVMMPGMDGYELCKRLKADVRTSHVPVILLTARASEDSVVRGLETGADAYVTKPFSTRVLLKRIENLILQRRQLQEQIKRRLMLKPEEIEVSPVDKEFIKELRDILEKKLSDEHFGIEQLGKKLYMGRTTLYRKIQALTGDTPSQFVRSYRLDRSAQLLRSNFGNITEVALEVGFSSTSYFTRCFKAKFGCSPSEY